MPQEVTLPSNMVGTVRALQVREANILADSLESRKNTTITSVLSNIWVGTTHDGPYKVPDNGKLDWKKVLVADRFMALVYSRIHTHGSAYWFKVQCSDDRCREKFEWEVDLLNDFQIKPIPQSSIDAFLAGNRLETKMDTGQKVWFKLMTGEDEQSVGKLGKSRLMSSALAARIVEIEGVSAADKVRYIETLELPVMQDLVEKLDEADGGMDTEIEVECTECGYRQEIMLPFGKDFFLPYRRKTEKEEKRRS